jgi:hypothetical protein
MALVSEPQFTPRVENRGHPILGLGQPGSEWPLQVRVVPETAVEKGIRGYRLEIQSVMLVFSTQLCELLSLPFSLVHLSPPPPLPCVIKGGGMGIVGGEGLRLINTCLKVPLQVNLF